MLMPVTRMGSKIKPKTTQHTATKTTIRIKVAFGFRPKEMTRNCDKNFELFVRV